MFKITFSISAFTFGGGYIVIPMMRKYFVDDLELITEQELMDMSAIAHSTPGAIAVNIAVLVGYRISGILGAIITGIGTVTPPLIILSLISVFYKSFRDNALVSAVLKGMEAGVAATIVDILIDMWQGIRGENNLLLSLMTPGPLVVNTASFVGIRIAGTLGAIVTTLGSILAGFIASILLYNFFNKNKDIDSIANILKGLRSSSVGLIASAATTIIILAFFGSQSISFGSASINISAVFIFIISLFLLKKYKLNPILIIVFTGLIGLFIY